MLYGYMKLDDETEIVHSQIIRENDNEKVVVHFEQPSEERGFDMARCEIPGCNWIIRVGYSEAEIRGFEELLQKNWREIFEIAREKGDNQ